MTTRLAGCVALVTGASSGIGEATARSLAAEGAATVLVARRLDRLEEIADELRATGATVLPIEADITQESQAIAAVELAVIELGRLDIVVNNAGALAMGPFAEAVTADWQAMISTNVEGVLFVSQAAIKHLIAAAKDSPRGVTDLVNVSSTSARLQRSGTAVYGLSKAAVNAFTESVRQELIPQNVRVSVIEPGTVQTDLIAPPAEAGKPKKSSGVQLLEPEDVADAITYMVTRARRVAINQLLLRAGEQTW